jgi:hypothetical protein
MAPQLPCGGLYNLLRKLKIYAQPKSPHANHGTPRHRVQTGRLEDFAKNSRNHFKIPKIPGIISKLKGRVASQHGLTVTRPTLNQMTRNPIQILKKPGLSLSKNRGAGTDHDSP